MANASSPGIYNTLVGVAAGSGTTSGSYNTYIGYMSGYFNTSGSNNAFVGFNAGNNNQTGSNNAYFGYGAGVRNITGSNNTYLGAISGSSGIQSSLNTFVGASTGLNNNGDGNTFIGNQAGQNNQSGGYNVFLGSQAGLANTTGQGNLFLGQQAGGQNTTASYNLFMGNSSGSNTTTGLGNTAIGDGSLLRNNTGIHNVAIGRFAGVESRNDENVFIGFAADVTPNTPNLTNATAIGARARVSQSNSIVLGANANVGIGNGAPTAKLHITTGTANTSGLRLENLPISSTATGGQTKFLTVDGAGNVILGSLSGSAREGAVEALWQRKGSFLQSQNGESIVIGSKVDKTPTGYSLFVGQGLLAEKVKVAVKNTSDWSDYVFKPGYALQPLAEVEQYIQEHEHLPGIPSAKEMVEQGNDLHKTDAKLLEKIEELTLYSIQLEKQLQANDKKHQAEIDELKQLVKQLVGKK
ncbi:autotransporter outer membrane beta-barrel domain-containing protein [Spirosoma agri]|nr:TMF family protein [Spirosoma agri]